MIHPVFLTDFRVQQREGKLQFCIEQTRIHFTGTQLESKRSRAVWLTMGSNIF